MKKLILLQVLLCFITLLILSIFKINFILIVIFAFLPIIIFSSLWFYWFRNIFFFRDPIRKLPQGDRIIVSPADGRIMYIYEVNNSEIICKKNDQNININEISKIQNTSGNGWLIGIYMTPFDVHYNYAPISGKVNSLYHFKAKINLPMVDLWEYINFTLLKRAVNLFSAKFHFENERMTFLIENNIISCVVILIADKFVNKITKYFNLNDSLKIGQKISFIERGSQVDLFIPYKNLTFKVKTGQQVYGKKTLIAEY